MHHDGILLSYGQASVEVDLFEQYSEARMKLREILPKKYIFIGTIVGYMISVCILCKILYFFFFTEKLKCSHIQCFLKYREGFFPPPVSMGRESPSPYIGIQRNPFYH